MNPSVLSIREMETRDIPLIVRYWQESDPEFLKGMGVDLSKIPSPESLTTFLSGQVAAPLREKQSFCYIWCVDEEAVGHNNINKIIFGEEAYMHLHLWHSAERRKGMGLEFIRKTIPRFFEQMQLKKLICEPYALNPAPNRILEKAGFRFVKEYVTIPGSLNFEQPVKRWELDASQVWLP